jgi:TrwC relaxase
MIMADPGRREVPSVTVMLSLHAGYDVGYLTDSVGNGGVDYYLSVAGQAGEPPGFWAGRGAEALGLSGEVDAQVMRNLYHHDIAPDGTVLERSNRAHTYQGMASTLAERTEEAVAARIAELGPDATEREIEEARLMVRGQSRNAVPFFDFTLSMAKPQSTV